MVVGTRNSSLEPQIDETVKNWVTTHVDEKFNEINSRLTDLMTQMHFVVQDVNRMKGGEGSSRFSRMGKLEFPKFYGDDVQGWMYRVKQFFAVDKFLMKIRSKLCPFICMIRL